jgi:ATP-binding protein involved in chromosome partitioning
LAEDTGAPFIGAIPIDKSVREGGDEGKPVIITQPDSAVAKALNAIAEDLAAKVSVAAMQRENIIPIDFVD